VLAPALLAGLSAIVVRVPHAYLLQAAMRPGSLLVIGHNFGLDLRRCHRRSPGRPDRLLAGS